MVGARSVVLPAGDAIVLPFWEAALTPDAGVFLAPRSLRKRRCLLGHKYMVSELALLHHTYAA